MSDGAGGNGDGDADGSLYEAFLEGERPGIVCIYLHEEGIGSVDDLLEIGTRVDDGVVLALPGDDGRAAFESATGLDPMDFAGEAMERDGDVAADLTGGSCPDDTDGDHHARFVLGFAEERNEDVGGIYAEGDVVHAYAACACGTLYSDRWIAGT